MRLERDAAFEAMSGKLRAIEVPVEGMKATAEGLLDGVELLNGKALTIGRRSEGKKLFSMLRDGGDRIFVPSVGNRPMLHVKEGDKIVQHGFLPGLLVEYLRCQRAANLGGHLPTAAEEADEQLVNLRNRAAVSALVDAIVESLASGKYEVPHAALEAVTAYVQTGAKTEGEEGMGRIGEDVTSEAVTSIVPFLQKVVNQ